MSIQFGKCNFDNTPVEPGDFEEIRPVLAPYGPDGEGFICRDNFAILYRPFFTTKESRREMQPHVCASGCVLTWDGRLDNREQLMDALSGIVSSISTDVEMVAAAYERWGTGSFARLIGDWALSIWNNETRTLLLAKDFIGARHLYYSAEKDRVTWCTVLDPLVLFSSHSFKLEEEYIAGCLSLLPAPHLTPYIGIRSVPPSCFVQCTSGACATNRYWKFDTVKRVRYREDSQYEEHFRAVFAESVRRRLRSDSPILAELSGGMDSSAIVCVADDVTSHGRSEYPRLDTLSYYDDTEPNWNERAYFTKVEEKRGRTGLHVDLGAERACVVTSFDGLPAVTPNLSFLSTQTRQEFTGSGMTRASRVLLSGTGGDEVTGGVPTPLPELEDLLSRLRLATLAKQLKSWALKQRKPWLHLLFGACARFLPPSLVGLPKHRLPAEWVQHDFARKHFAALTGYPSRIRFFGPLPSFQENISTLEALRRQLAYSDLSHSHTEKRYPYLDRDLVEFLFAVPREQLVRPGQRRSLMRRALKGIVPDEILNRKRKAFVARSPITDIQRESSLLSDVASHMASGATGLVDANAFLEAVRQVCRGEEVPLIPLMRTISIEFWLRQLQHHGFLSSRLEISFSPGPNGAIRAGFGKQKVQLAGCEREP